MKNLQEKINTIRQRILGGNVIKAHEATGQTTMREHESRMKNAVTKSIQGDVRFMPKENVSDAARSMGCKPYCLDVTTPDTEGQHHAIIRNHEGKLVKHAFDYDHEEGTATMHDGQPSETERKEIYATEIDRHENMVKAMADTLACRAADGNGIKISAAEPWTPGKSVTYIYVPGGISTINAGFRRNESITCTVNVDDVTAKDLQESFDFIAATEKQEPYADEDHEGKKATLRFPARKVNFTYGTHRNEEGVIVSGAEPTTYGADSVNGKIYASWSPEFATDADYSKAKCKKGHWTFPDGIRGSASNPARIVAVSFVTGALTNKPAFKNMPPVKAKLTLPPVEDETLKASGTSEGVKKSWEKRTGRFMRGEGADDLQRPHSDAGGFAKREHAQVHFENHILKSPSHWMGVKKHQSARVNEVEETHGKQENEAVEHLKSKGWAVYFHKKMTDEENPESNLNKDDPNLEASDAAESDALRAAETTTDAGKSGYEHQCKLAQDASESADNATKTAKDKAGHRMACDLHHEACKQCRLAADAAQNSGNAVKAKEHSEKANAHSQKSTDHFKQAMAEEKVTATDEPDSLLATIFARHKQGQDYATAIAAKSPDVQARLKAAAEKPDTTVANIAAREEQNRAFERTLVARSPLAANREALEKITERNRETITATGSSDGAKKGWLLRRKSDGWFAAPGGKHTSSPDSAMHLDEKEKHEFHNTWGKNKYDLVHKKDAKEVE